MAKRKEGIGKGVLDPKARRGKFVPSRYHPSAALSDYVLHFWQVTWSLPADEPFTQHNIPYPAVHIVFEEGRSEVVGPITGRFTRVIEGDGRVFGAHIHPGMFRTLCDGPVAEFVDKRIPLGEAFALPGRNVAALATRVLQSQNGDSVAPFEDFLLSLVDLSRVESGTRARNLVQLVESDVAITRARQLAECAGCSLRSLQRLFAEYVGLSPKFVIRRFRMLQAAERLLDDVEMAALADELGFSDQAHFIRAFKDLVGTTPKKYAERNR